MAAAVAEDSVRCLAGRAAAVPTAAVAVAKDPWQGQEVVVSCTHARLKWAQRKVEECRAQQRNALWIFGGARRAGWTFMNRKFVAGAHAWLQLQG